MIPRAHINAWRKVAPWPDSAQVEQDLALSRALVELYRRPEIAQGVVFRGGTALHKLFFQPPVATPKISTWCSAMPAPGATTRSSTPAPSSSPA